jgi:hypothetical protein
MVMMELVSSAGRAAKVRGPNTGVATSQAGSCLEGGTRAQQGARPRAASGATQRRKTQVGMPCLRAACNRSVLSRETSTLLDASDWIVLSYTDARGLRQACGCEVLQAAEPCEEANGAGAAAGKAAGGAGGSCHRHEGETCALST